VATRKSSRTPSSNPTDPPPFVLTPPKPARVRRVRAEFVPGSTTKPWTGSRVPNNVSPPLDHLLAKMSPIEELSLGELNTNLRRLTRRRDLLERNFPSVQNAVQQEARDDIRDIDLVIQRIKLALIRKDRLESPSEPRAIKSETGNRWTPRASKGKKTQIADATSTNRNRPASVEQQSTSPKEPIFSHSDDYRSVRLSGIGYALTANQAAIVKCLHDAHAGKHPDVAKARLLSAIGSKTSEVRNSFKKSPLWKTLVIPGERRGTYRLNLPDSL